MILLSLAVWFGYLIASIITDNDTYFIVANIWLAVFILLPNDK